MRSSSGFANPNLPGSTLSQRWKISKCLRLHEVTSRKTANQNRKPPSTRLSPDSLAQLCKKLHVARFHLSPNDLHEPFAWGLLWRGGSLLYVCGLGRLSVFFNFSFFLFHFIEHLFDCDQLH